MKKLLYKIFKSTVYKRTLRLKTKQKNRLNRVKEVIDELNRWHDIPVSMQLQGLCETLKIRPDEAARRFVTGLVYKRVDAEKEARKLPLV